MTGPARSEAADFAITLLPAGQGDCLLLEYGRPGAYSRVLIDGGPARSYGALAARLIAIPPRERRLDLLVLTHVDADHIEGVIKLLNDADLAVDVAEVWFNGYKQLPPDPYLGAAQGEILSTLLAERKIPWNTAFGGGAVQRHRGSALPRVTLPGGLVLTVVGPDDAALRSLRTAWEKECRSAGIAPGSTRDALDLLARQKRLRPLDTYLAPADVTEMAARPEQQKDKSVTNASSIVLLAEYGGRSVLLAGDSTPTVLAAGLERLLAERRSSVLEVGAVKLPHHGSRHNVTREVLDLIRSPVYLVSTDSSYFSHPDPEAIARLITHEAGRPRLVFNYRTKITDQWSDNSLLGRYSYQVEYAVDSTNGIWVAI
jgi:beta-lactamase superfamily II metal-dependent hydrolase